MPKEIAKNKKDYSELSKDDLIKIVEKLESRKKYGLIWDEEKVKEQFEKDAVNALPVLKEVKGKEISDKNGGPVNILIEGDNYHALSVLNFTHQGKIDFIYIDPPYNTGARDWKYNNDYVDDSDSFRHSKWLSFMDKRLRLAKNLLKDDGVICVTIDDYELPRLWMNMEEIFGHDNHLGTLVIRNNPKGRMTKRKLSLVHEYALFFGKTSESFVRKLPVAPEDKTHNYQKDGDGNWFLQVNLRKQGVDSSAVNKTGKLSDRYYPIYFDPKTGQVSSIKKLPVEILPIDPTGQKRIWRRSKDVIDQMCKVGDLWVKKQTTNGYQVYYKFRGGLEGQTPQSIWYDAEFSASEYGTSTLDKILGKREMFQYPKSPFAVMKSILSGTNDKDATILDFFAGSGTTGQAVLELNKQDGGGRRFILCTNNENNICDEVCYPRVKKVITGYKGAKDSDVKGLGGSLKYFKTKFVTDASNKDDFKIRITKECTEMLCLREGIFDEIKKTDDYRIFQQGDQTLAVYYSLDRKALSDLKKELNKIDGDKVFYCFTLDPIGVDKSDFIGWNNVSLEPIPQKILDVYKQIYEY
ncbi:MAG: site-specific DNA-methyltransferase [Candidatus Paceibacterota bacterium]|jgi:adenine-specific DNA-methyltransferase